MKLTKDDFFNNDKDTLWRLAVQYDDMLEILKNQEDAEKYRNQPEIVTLTLKYREIVERLKKLLVGKTDAFSFTGKQLRTEILGEK